MILGNFLTASVCPTSTSCWRGSQRCWRGQTFLEVTPSPTAIRDPSQLLYTWGHSDPQRVQRSAGLCPGLAQGTESWKGQDAFCRTPRKYLYPILLHELIVYIQLQYTPPNQQVCNGKGKFLGEEHFIRHNSTNLVHLCPTISYLHPS